MRAIITVTEFQQTPGRYTVKVSAPGIGRPGECRVFGAGAAASQAISYAIEYGKNGYHIFGSEKVMSQIPPDMVGKLE